MYQAGLETPGSGRHLAGRRRPRRLGSRRGAAAESWRRCLDVAHHVVDQSRTRFAGEIARLDPTTQIGLPPSEFTTLSASWDTCELRAALATLATVDLDRIFADLREQSEPEPQEQQERPFSARLDRRAGPPGVGGRAVRRVARPPQRRTELHHRRPHARCRGRGDRGDRRRRSGRCGGRRWPSSPKGSRPAARSSATWDAGGPHTPNSPDWSGNSKARIDRSLLSGGTNGV